MPRACWQPTNSWYWRPTERLISRQISSLMKIVFYNNNSQARSSIPSKRPLMNLLLESWIRWYRFHIHLCIPACVMSSEFTGKVVMKFIPPQYSWNWCKCVQSNYFLPIKDFQIWPNKEKLSYKNAAHHACRNADVNSILGATTTNRYIFQIIDLEMESVGVH